jgi:hypothetical protein
LLNGDHKVPLSIVILFFLVGGIEPSLCSATERHVTSPILELITPFLFL